MITSMYNKQSINIKHNKNKDILNNKNNKIKITLQSYKIKKLDEAISHIFHVCKSLNIKYDNVVSLPTYLFKFPIVRSSFVFKDSKEHFGIKIYKKFFYIYYSEISLINVFNIKIDESVNVKINRI